MGQRKKVVLADRAKGRTQNFGQGQVVFAIQHRLDQRQQILDRQFPGQGQPIRARHRHAQGFQVANQTPGQFIALAHEDENVSGRDRTRGAAVAPRQPFLGDHAADFGRQTRGETPLRMIRRGRIDWFGPMRFLGFFLRLDQRPEIDPRRIARAMGGVADRRIRARHPFARPLVAENRIDERENPGGGTERSDQVRALEPFADPLQMRGVFPALFVKFRRVRALEGVNRLFLIADDEDRPCEAAPPIARIRRAPRIARVKITGERLNHPPLRWSGILRFIDQHVIDPPVEPVEHPCPHIRPRQQILGPCDQVVEIEE